jgi:HD-like signal output (HDOD) protein
MALQGNLKTVRVPELFSLLHQLRKTGILTVVSETEERGFLFYKGNLVYATTKDTSKRLGTFLVRLGVITQEDLNAEAETEGTTEIYFGQRLVDSGRVSRSEINAAVEEQILDIMEEILPWHAGAFHFDDNELPFAIPDGILVSTHAILLEASRRSDEKNYVRGLFPDVNVVLGRTEGGGAAELDKDETDMAAYADGKRTLEQILFANRRSAKKSATLLHSLVQKGALSQVGVHVLGNQDPPVPELLCPPVSPMAPATLFAIFNREDSQMPRLVEVLEQDPLLTAKVLKALTLRSVEIPRASLGVAHLVGLLGTFQLRSLLVPEALRGLFFAREDSLWKEFWEHSVLCARLCRSIAMRVRYPFHEEAYLAGLLHNLGVFVLMNNAPRKYWMLVEEAAQSEQDLEVLEEERFGISHTKIGGIYAEKWSFPRALLIPIRYHHKVDRNVANPLLNILAAAIGTAQESGMGIEYMSSAGDQFYGALKRLRINRKQALALLEEVPREAACSAY